jgi:hypothetical protein
MIYNAGGGGEDGMSPERKYTQNSYNIFNRTTKKEEYASVGMVPARQGGFSA